MTRVRGAGTRWAARRSAQRAQGMHTHHSHTLTALTAHSCAHEVMRHAPETAELLVCGGGAFNIVLMQLLQSLLHILNAVAL
jgi:anhydro-N-acetylmuramic acid kinase